MSTLALTPDIYSPTLNDDGEYIDNFTDDYRTFKNKYHNGLKCPCTGHIFEKRGSFIDHTKCQTHLKWLNNYNKNDKSLIQKKTEKEHKTEKARTEKYKTMCEAYKIEITSYKLEIKNLNEKNTDLNEKYTGSKENIVDLRKICDIQDEKIANLKKIRDDLKKENTDLKLKLKEIPENLD